MNLLDYKRLERKFNINNPVNTFYVNLYSVKNDKVVVHSNLEFPNEIFSDEVGEYIIKENEIFLCIGKDVNCRNNIKRSAKGLISILKRYKKHEINFKDSPYTQDVVFGFIMVGYEYDFLKEESDFSCKLTTNYERIVKIAHSQNFARFLGDTPANLMTPALFCEYAQSFIKAEIIILQKEDLKKENMNIMLSVSQGSDNEPKLLHMKYYGKEDNQVDVALVGKGVTFDSGGISIKPSANMHKMKMDMMGGATLLSTFKLVVDMKLGLNVALTIPLVENTINGLATKPGDVYKGKAGKTVEINDTDAEGRLILADALVYAQKSNPKYLFDAATLTGCIVVALGNVFSGFFTESDQLNNIIYKAGIEEDDEMWRMPFSPFFKEDIESNVADVCNIGSTKPDSSHAAEFLKTFVKNVDGYVHFDIAGVMDEDYCPDIYGKEATGRPVRTFINILEKLSKQ